MAPDISVMNWMRTEPVERSIARAAGLGYTGIVITGDPEIDPDVVRSALDAHEIECWGAVTIMSGARDLTHPDPYIRRATVDYVKDTLAFAGKVGGKVVTVTPAVGKLAPVADRRQEWDWLVAGLREAQAVAGELGIRLGIESLNRFETYLCNRSELAVELAAEVGDGFGVVLDLFHMNIEEPDFRAALEVAGPLLVDFHIADNNRRPPGQGALEWGAVLDGLDAIGYDGSLTVEFFYTPDLSEEQFDEDVSSAIRFIRRQLAEAGEAAGQLPSAS